MKIRELLDDWSTHSYDPDSAVKLSVNLPLNQLAHIMALTELYPGHSKEQIITDLLQVALDEVEAGLPYIKGDRVVAEDEFGDPIYEDIGMTPRFLELSRKHLQQLQSKHKSATAE